MNEFREQLVEELDREPPLIVAALVDGALRQGRRAVARRRLRIRAVAAGLVLILGMVAWLIRLDPSPTSLQPAGPDLTSGPTAPATAATIAIALARRLPTGATLTQVFRYEQDPPAAAVYVDRGGGDALLQLTIDPYRSTMDTCRSVAARSVTCETEPDGSLVAVARVSGDCLQDTVVERFRTDGVHVSVFLATCRSGRAVTPAALTTAEARSLVADPVWASWMDADLVAEGAARYPLPPLWTAP